MLNAEKYKKELLEFTKKEKSMKFALKEDNTNMFADCRDICCVDCLLSTTEDICPIERMKWLLSEYKAPIKLSRLEYEFLKWSEKKGHKYIVRDKINHLFIFKDAPIKRENCWVPESSYCSIALFDNLFKFIKQEDEEPIAIKDILENCEVVNDAEE